MILINMWRNFQKYFETSRKRKKINGFLIIQKISPRDTLRVPWEQGKIKWGRPHVSKIKLPNHIVKTKMTSNSAIACEISGGSFTIFFRSLIQKKKWKMIRRRANWKQISGFFFFSPTLVSFTECQRQMDLTATH